MKDLLLISGDVKTNPGPDLSQIVKQLNQIAVDITEIKKSRLASIDKKLECLSALDTRNKDGTEQVAFLEKTVADVELKIDDLENCSRRSNLIVYGIQEIKK